MCILTFWVKHVQIRDILYELSRSACIYVVKIAGSLALTYKDIFERYHDVNRTYLNSLNTFMANIYVLSNCTISHRLNEIKSSFHVIPEV